MPFARAAAQAKINLLLLVGPRRSDGYHDVGTMLQLVDLADDLIVRVGGAGRTLHVAGPRLPDEGLGATEKNLAFRAAVAYADRARWPDGFSIELHKNIPTGGGLGGGSADAGAVLRALDALAERPLGPTALTEIAATLGSDVPFFVSGSARGFAVGRGDEVGGMDPLPARHVLLALPSFGIPTPNAYRWLDEDREAGRVETESVPVTASADIVVHEKVPESLNDWVFIGQGSSNSFEAPVERRHPELAVLRESMASAGARIARLSGSGSTVFGVFDRLPELPNLPGASVIRTMTSTRVVPVVVQE